MKEKSLKAAKWCKAYAWLLFFVCISAGFIIALNEIYNVSAAYRFITFVGIFLAFLFIGGMFMTAFMGLSTLLEGNAELFDKKADTKGTKENQNPVLPSASALDDHPSDYADIYNPEGLPVQKTKDNTIDYVIFKDGTVGIIKYYGSKKNIDIPMLLEDKTVVYLGSEAIADKDKAWTVSLPSSLLLIDTNALINCPALEKIFFRGPESKWKKVIVKRGNEVLANVKVETYHG